MDSGAVPCLPVRYADNDLKDAARVAALAARQRARVDRLIRDPRGLTAVDVGALDAQVAAKRVAAAAAQAASAGDARALADAGTAWDAAARNAAAARAATAVATALAWGDQVAAAPRRAAADLNDPRAQAKAAPIRLPGGEADGRLGPSSAQVFAGEDPGAKARAAAHAAALAARLAQQQADAAEADRAEREADR
jgi:hypothetical protein